MAAERADADHQTERCSACKSETQHEVRLEIRTESLAGENEAFSREPYRVATCTECGSTTEQRMNNA